MSTATRKSDNRKKGEEIDIPDKLYFRIGEVGRLCHLPPYVLRFWETEFPQLKPAKGSTGQRMYRRRDVEFVVRIRKLLYEDGYTIAGARHLLKAEGKPSKSQPALPFQAIVKQDGLRRVRQQLQEILSLLSTKSKVARPTAGRH
ncbi:MAG TPA: MerR family transcriptional regulator [Terriglobales bacterium]|nr:MerR family transcriptional regulator [Terriglobales bacterium]